MEKLSIQRKSDRVPDSSIYVDTLVRLFDATRMVEEWLEYFEASESGGASGTTRDVVGKLKGVAAFLGSVVCAFVMRDFEVLLERFLKKMRNVAVA
ncbi:hypothetical protein HK104_004351 [Borealophlyctis nickersoniae]|nr:hypothetical protein HK104_004351 [Borealophlyctis nickersoniae]